MCDTAPTLEVTQTVGGPPPQAQFNIPVSGLSHFEGSCGGIGPEWVGIFTAARPGVWSFELSEDQATAIYLRSVCTRPESECAAQCAPNGVDGTTSVSLRMQLGESIYIFVDTLIEGVSEVISLDISWDEL